MKLTIERDHALKALTNVQSIAKGKGSIPILAHVKLEAADGALVFTANDTKIQASDSARAEVHLPGATTVSAGALFGYVRAWPSGGQIAMEIQADGRLAVRCARSRCLMTTLPAEEFPVFPALDDAAGGMIGRDALARLLTRTRFACSQEETKYLMTGVWLHTTDDGDPPRVVAVATDKVSMAVAETPAPDGFVLEPGYLLPAVAADEITRLLATADDFVELRFTRTLFELRCGATEIVGKLLELQGEGWFNWPIAFQQGHQYPAAIDHDLMQASIGRVLLTADDKLRTVDMAFTPGALALSARSELGDGQLSETLDVAYDAPDRSIRVNAKKVKDVLGQIQGESAVFHVPDLAEKAILITDSADDRCRYMIVQHRGS